MNFQLLQVFLAITKNRDVLHKSEEFKQNNLNFQNHR